MSLPRFGLTVLLGLLLAALLATPALARDVRPSAEADLVARVNAARADHGLPTLTPHPGLVDVARGWSSAMADVDVLSHNPAIGPEVSAALSERWLQLGENVGFVRRSADDEAGHVEWLHTAFMESEGHRRNILGDWDRLGVGVEVAPNGRMWATVVFMRSDVPAAATPAPVADSPVVTEALDVSRATFADRGSDGRHAQYAVIGRDDVFADSLGAAGLAGGAAPVLFTPGPSPSVPEPALAPGVRAELTRLLDPGATVYLLGGTGAVSSGVEREVAGLGLVPRRLAGPSRVETSVVVAEEILARHGDSGEVLIARADDWPDAVTGGAYAAATHSPVLLTGRDGLHPEVGRYLGQRQPARRWALGGPAALPDQVVSAAGAERVHGADRTGTAVAVAERLWERRSGLDGDTFVGIPSGASTAWAGALAHAPWSAVHVAPQLLVHDGAVPDSVRDYLSGLGYGKGAAGALRGANGLDPATVNEVRELLG